mmetsp:Transcript_11410/g.24060  ORF Transcript_11410/g.24060 Transcript_11410/m.24060 type:complete len:263 (+) Transcript_11410:185-973(+)
MPSSLFHVIHHITIFVKVDPRRLFNLTLLSNRSRKLKFSIPSLFFQNRLQPTNKIQITPPKLHAMRMPHPQNTPKPSLHTRLLPNLPHNRLVQLFPQLHQSPRHFPRAIIIPLFSHAQYLIGRRMNDHRPDSHLMSGIFGDARWLMRVEPEDERGGGVLGVMVAEAEGVCEGEEGGAGEGDGEPEGIFLEGAGRFEGGLEFGLEGVDVEGVVGGGFFVGDGDFDGVMRVFLEGEEDVPVVFWFVVLRRLLLCFWVVSFDFVA